MSNALQPDTLPVVNGFLLVVNTLVALAVYFGPKLLDAGTVDDLTSSGASGMQSVFASGLGEAMSQLTPIEEQPRARMQGIREDEEESTSSENQEDSEKLSQRPSASRVGFDGRIQTHGLGNA